MEYEELFEDRDGFLNNLGNMVSSHEALIDQRKQHVIMLLTLYLKHIEGQAHILFIKLFCFYFSPFLAYGVR